MLQAKVMRLGEKEGVRSKLRMTPAGLISAGTMAAATPLALAGLMRAGRRGSR